MIKKSQANFPLITRHSGNRQSITLEPLVAALIIRKPPSQSSQRPPPPNSGKGVGECDGLRGKGSGPPTLGGAT